MKFRKSSSKGVKNSKQGLSLVLHILQKVAMFPNFGHDKLATLPKFGHGNRATLPNRVLGNRAILLIMTLAGSKDAIWKRCPISKDTILTVALFLWPNLGSIASFSCP